MHNGDERQTASSAAAATERLRDADAVRSMLAGRHSRRCSMDCMSVLSTACRSGDLAIVQLLLAQHRGATSDVAVNAQVLHSACAFGQYNIVKWLVTERLSARSSDLEREDAHGRTPLMVAGMRQHLSVVWLLSTAGASLAHLSDWNVDIALECATHGHTNMLAFLSANDVSRCDSSGGHASVVELLLRIHRDSSNCSCVTRIKDNAALVTVGVCHANMNSANAAPFELTPVEVTHSRGHDAVVAFLLQRGAQSPEHSVLDYESYWEFSDDTIHDRSTLSLEQQRHIQYWDRKEALDLLFAGYLSHVVAMMPVRTTTSRRSTAPPD